MHYCEAVRPKIETVDACVSAAPGISLENLLSLTRTIVEPDDIFVLIAAGDLYVDLHAAPLAEPSRVQVLMNRESPAQKASPELGKAKATLYCGKRLFRDGRSWQIVNLGEKSISLLSEDRTVADLPIVAFEALVRDTQHRAWKLFFIQRSLAARLLRLEDFDRFPYFKYEPQEKTRLSIVCRGRLPHWR